MFCHLNHCSADFIPLTIFCRFHPCQPLLCRFHPRSTTGLHVLSPKSLFFRFHPSGIDCSADFTTLTICPAVFSPAYWVKGTKMAALGMWKKLWDFSLRTTSTVHEWSAKWRQTLWECPVGIRLLSRHFPLVCGSQWNMRQLNYEKWSKVSEEYHDALRVCRLLIFMYTTYLCQLWNLLHWLKQGGMKARKVSIKRTAQGRYSK